MGAHIYLLANKRTDVRQTYRRPVVAWSALLLVLVGGHDLSHALDGGLDTSLAALAVVALPQWLLLLVVTSVIVRGDRAQACAAALLLAAGVIVGFALVHLLPFSSESYWHLHPSALSWLMVIAPPAAGLVLAMLAWKELRHGSG